MTNWPTSEVVSHQVSPRLTKPQEPCSRSCKMFEQVAAGTRQAIQLGHHDRIPGLQRPHQFLELGPAIGRLAGYLLREDPRTAGRLEGVDLDGVVLFGGADPGVPVAHRKTPF